MGLHSSRDQHWGFPCGSTGKESACNAGDLGLTPGLGRFLGEGTSYPLQYHGLENSMDCIVHGVAESGIRLSGFHFHFRGQHQTNQQKQLPCQGGDGFFSFHMTRHWTRSLAMRPQSPNHWSTKEVFFIISELLISRVSFALPTDTRVSGLSHSDSIGLPSTALGGQFSLGYALISTFLYSR